MKRTLIIAVLVLFTAAAFAQNKKEKKSDKKGWISLFDGKTLEGWRINENPQSFQVVDGIIKVDGPRAHLFYEGPVNNSDFKNFEFKAQVKTEPGANSGIFIHTQFQESGWPDKGYEIQVNQSHGDWRKTGSVYSFADVKEVYVQDNEWYTEHIIVKDGKITVKINGEVVVEYVEAEDQNRPENAGQKKLSSGTFALQAHDPESVIYYKDIMVKPLK
ncbi:MAG TPA: DUF1080 domain-containing protein [Cyclobacteriaceae bacterium]|nr:DUF1080 domain-containing protein [Cyclobacteriaceae bacterium]